MNYKINTNFQGEINGLLIEEKHIYDAIINSINAIQNEYDIEICDAHIVIILMNYYYRFDVSEFTEAHSYNVEADLAKNLHNIERKSDNKFEFLSDCSSDYCDDTMNKLLNEITICLNNLCKYNT